MVVRRLFVVFVLLLQLVGGRAEHPSRRVRGVHQTNKSTRRTESTRRRLMNDDKDAVDTPAPSPAPTPAPTPAPSPLPTEKRNDKDDRDDDDDTPEPIPSPTIAPVDYPTTSEPVGSPTLSPTTSAPTEGPTGAPSPAPTDGPTLLPTTSPSLTPTLVPTSNPTGMPTQLPSLAPSLAPSVEPSVAPSVEPSMGPTSQPSLAPSSMPSIEPSMAPSPQPSAMPSMSPKVDLTEFYILLTKIGGEINVGAVTKTLESYLYDGMKAKFSTLEYVSLDLLEGDSAYDSFGKMSSALRYAGVVSFSGHGTEPDQTTLNAEEGFLLTTSENAFQSKVAANPAMTSVIVEEISFDIESLDACQPFPNDCRGEIIEEDNMTMILVASLGGVSLCVMLCATVILRRQVKARAAMEAETEEADPASKVVLDDTSVSLPSGEVHVKPGCASLVGSAMVELDEKQTASRLLNPPKSPGTPYSAERPQEIQVRNFGDSEDDLDLGYLTMDEDLKSQYFDPSKHAHDALTLDGTQTLDDGDQSTSDGQSVSPL